MNAPADIRGANIVVIGCGNANRSDDGVGPHVISLLRDPPLPAEVRLFDAGTDGMGVLYRARGATHLVIVDARIPEGSPGAIHEVPGAVLENPPAPSLNLHDFRWDNALYAGRRIYGDDFPAHVSVLLIEAESLELGLSLSPPVEAAARSVAARIREMAGEWLSGEAAR